MAQATAQGWRITTVNGLLLALYFVPAWTIAAFKIVMFPIRGIYERANVGPALFVNDTFQLSMLGTVRFAWLLVLAKFVVVAYFLLFAALTLRPGGGRQRCAATRRWRWRFCSAASSASPACWPHRPSAKPQQCACTPRNR